LASLDERQAELLLLRASGLSYSEVAAALDLNPASAGTLISLPSKRFERSIWITMDNNESKVSQWVDEHLAALDPASDWQPDTAKALQRLHGRQGWMMRRRWVSAAATAAAACLILVALDPPSACATPRSCVENLVHNIRPRSRLCGRAGSKETERHCCGYDGL
jgi:hypothetical protein